MTGMQPRDPHNPGAPLIPRVGWDMSPWNRWTFQHVREMTTTAPIWRGSGPVRPLPESLQPLGELMVSFPDGKCSVADFLELNFTAGLLVLHRGRIVLEYYMDCLRPQNQHLVMSATKSFTGTLTGMLMNKGLLDVRKPVTHYLPELAATAYRGATVQQLLDMSSGVIFDESLNEGSHMQKGLYAGWYRQPVPGWPRTYWELILSLDEAERSHGALFNYRSIESCVLGFVLQRVSGMSLADLMSYELWVPMGAEEDAYIVVDDAGFAIASGGLCATLRDLGRFAQLLVEGGAWGGRQIIPSGWIEATRNGGVELPEDMRKLLPNGAYHNQWWIEDTRRRTIWARGHGGQTLYVDPGAEFAAVKLSAFPDDDTVNQRWIDDRVALLAIRAALSER
ncbi:MAG: class C beta-lactamase-related serine hydrolase [Mesorhizobium sp.]|nr:MAG: class C beta-lactamase-related serine hydrolase [Mesorhizobium sp.]RWO75391.1 MAG: class C beta-lactamase-related serine hydrolase [Mesorhizobium sp.]TJU74359.1 MAG: serine hydrolase [Mesorhizobium sp.]